MKTLHKLSTLILFFSLISVANAQQAEIDFYRTNDKGGLGVFETPKAPAKDFDGVKVRVGGDFALQIQSLSQENKNKDFVDLETNLNLPTANLNIDVQLQKGVRMHLRTYLSSRHHNEAWVKGGYMQIDDLDFISEGFLSNLMQYTTFRAGMDEINFGDSHFSRTDNARAIYNPMVGNYIMDSFSTEPFLEANFQYNNMLAVLGVSNGKLNQSTVTYPGTDNSLSYYAKLGYDRQFNEDFRGRITASIYTNSGKSTGGYLYGSDRAGDRFYNVGITKAEDAAGTTFVQAKTNAQFNPNFKQLTAMQFAGFLKYRGLESFTIFEFDGNSKNAVVKPDGHYTQIAEELLFRFGNTEQFYIGGRYNKVFGYDQTNAGLKEIQRFEIGGGWYMMPNVLTKLEYVTQSWTGEGFNTSKWEGAKFNGVMIEAVIAF